MPDNRLTVSCTVQQGETIVIEATYSGTHTGPDGFLPPTGLTFAFPYVDILTAREDKIVKRHIYWDNMTFLSSVPCQPRPAGGGFPSSALGPQEHSRRTCSLSEDAAARRRVAHETGGQSAGGI